MYDNHFARSRTAPPGTIGTIRVLARHCAADAVSAGAANFGRVAAPDKRDVGKPSERPISRWRRILRALVASVIMAEALLSAAEPAQAQGIDSQSVVKKISGLSDKMELTTNTSRILTLDKNIPRVQVNNPELLAVTPLSANQVQISAKKAGVTQINLWDEDGAIHTVDVMIYGDARELEVALQTQFPHSAIKVYRYSESLVLKGFVDRPDYVSQIMRLAEDYAPKVINNISVGGVQQILLKVKVMEVSRTKLRNMGVDWAAISSRGAISASSVSGMISQVSQHTPAGAVETPNVDGGPGVIDNLGTFQFGIVDSGSAFFGFIDALKQNRIAKILAEPNLVAVSGRPAQFNVGGEFPILVPQSLGTLSIEYKPYGTQIDFLPIVLGNGNIRLEVRPRISEIDAARSVVLDGNNIPALTVRQIDTAAEMSAGQTFALAGLVQERSESFNRGVPYLSDLPILGIPFRRTRDEINEIELLIMVTPEFVDAMDPTEAPCGGPGYATTTPDNIDLYCAGHVEVPASHNPISGMTVCGECGGPGGQCGCAPGGQFGLNQSVVTDGMNMPGGVGYEGDTHGPAPAGQGRAMSPIAPSESSLPIHAPDDLELPAANEGSNDGPSANGANMPRRGPNLSSRPVNGVTSPRPYNVPRQPVYTRNATKPNNPPQADAQPSSSVGENGLIGPVGYDVQ